MDLITNPYSPLFGYTYPDDLIDRDELISIDREELEFLFELNKPLLSSFRLSNNSEKHVAFRVKTTNLKKYSVQPKIGIVLPHSQTDVTVTMQALEQAPSILECNDRFLVQCVAAPAVVTLQDITPEMFDKEVGNHVEEYKLSADFVVPSELEDSEEETSENDTSVSAGSSDHQIASSKFKDLMSMLDKDPHSFMRRLQDEPLEDLISTFINEKLSIIQEDEKFQDEMAKDVMSMLTKQKQSIIQEINSTLKEKVEILKRGSRRNNDGGRLSIYVLLIAVLGILLVHIYYI